MNRPFLSFSLGLVVAALASSSPVLRAQTPSPVPSASRSPSPSPSPGATPTPSPTPSATPAAHVPVQDVHIVLHTDKGDIEATIFASKVPITSANFLNLAQQKFYDGLKFHRVIQDFMIQGGDPLGNGKGDPGYKFEDEKNDNRKFDKPGVIAMANAGTNTNGSQFFITHVPTPFLDDGGRNGHYTIFGQVTKGQDVVNAIAQGDHIKSIDILDSTDPLFAEEKDRLEKWNAGLVHPPKH